jgi:hypothetical protein
MKRAVKIVVLAAVVLVVLGAIKNTIAQTVLTTTLSNVAHVPVKIGSTRVSFMSASIEVKNLRVYNPAGFPDKLMLDVPQVFIEFDPPALSKGQAHFKTVKLDLKELQVIRDKSGRLNVDVVKPTKTETSKAQSEAKATSGGKAPKLHIDLMLLSIGRVVYKDYTGGGEPAIQTFDINIENREYRDIQDPTAVVSVIMFEALTRTTLSKLADLDLHSFKEGGLNALSESLGIVGNGQEAVQNTAKKLLNLFN